MSKKPYVIKYVWNGNIKSVAFTEEYETEEEWHEVLWSQPYDIIDELVHVAYVDYGDNDDA